MLFFSDILQVSAGLRRTGVLHLIDSESILSQSQLFGVCHSCSENSLEDSSSLQLAVEEWGSPPILGEYH